MPTEAAHALDLLAPLDAEGRRPDVILMDLQMAPLDGIESTRQVRARYDDVEVVALTSFAEEERVHAALEAGASGYLLKDADADEVAAAVRAAHRGELQLDPVIARRLMSSLRAAATYDPTAELTSRELEVLRLVGAGKANKEIAAELADQRADGPDPRVEHPPQTRPQLAHAGRPLGGARRARGRGARAALAARGGPTSPHNTSVRQCSASSSDGAPRGAPTVEYSVPDAGRLELERAANHEAGATSASAPIERNRTPISREASMKYSCGVAP